MVLAFGGSEYVAGGAVVNLRENVIENRIRYSVSAMDDKTRQNLLGKALRSVRPSTFQGYD